MEEKNTSSWDNVSSWYNRLVSNEGHLYHQKVILPKLLDSLALRPHDALLDLGCGQGVLERCLPKTVRYLGIDVAKNLIAQAKKKSTSPLHQFLPLDLMQEPKNLKEKFHAAVMLLSFQNMPHPGKALQWAYCHLHQEGKLILVLNHPCFRIPRQTHWGFDEKKQLQFRRLDRYLSPLKIPIHTHPGQKDSKATFSYHFSLTDISKMLTNCQFVITAMEEWCCHKTSTGKRAKAENLARKEFPLFLTICAKKEKTVKVND